MLFLTLLGLGAVVLLISRSLRPLQWIVAGAESIAKGDLHLAHKQLAEHPVHSIDEIGAVYQAMIKMSGNINNILKTIVSNVSHTSDQYVAMTESFNTEAHHLLEMNTKVNVSIQMLAEGANTQQLSTNESAHSMEEMATAIQRISEASLTASDASMNALESAESGQTIVMNMNGQFVTITSATEEALNLAALLRGHSHEIVANIAKASSDGTLNIHKLTQDQLKIAQEIADSATALSGLTDEMRVSIQRINV